MKNEMKNTDPQKIEFLEHDHYCEMTKVVYENGHTYDLENSEDYRVELANQHAEIMRLRKALADALESMEDADMQLAERVIRRGLDDNV